MTIDANNVRDRVQGLVQGVADSRTTHVDVNLGRFAAFIIAVSLQRKVQKNVLVEAVGKLGQRPRARRARQERISNGAGQVEGALAIGQVVAEIIDDDGDTRRLGGRGAGKHQKQGGENSAHSP